MLALAQQAQKPATGLITEKVLSLDMAQDMARGALDKCRAERVSDDRGHHDAAGNIGGLSGAR